MFRMETGCFLRGMSWMFKHYLDQFHLSILPFTFFTSYRFTSFKRALNCGVFHCSPILNKKLSLFSLSCLALTHITSYMSVGYSATLWLSGPQRRILVRWVPCHHGMVRPHVADGGDALQVWRVAANILNKQSRWANKGWSSSFGVERGANNFSP
jgi:hypothetical protein